MEIQDGFIIINEIRKVHNVGPHQVNSAKIQRKLTDSGVISLKNLISKARSLVVVEVSSTDLIQASNFIFISPRE